MSIVTDPYGDNWVVNENDNDTALDRIFDMIDNESRKVDIMLQSLDEIDVAGRVMPETYSAMEKYTPEILEDIIPGNEFFKKLSGKTKLIVDKIMKAFVHFLIMMVSIFVGTFYHLLKIMMKRKLKKLGVTKDVIINRSWWGDVLEYRRLMLGGDMVTDDDRYNKAKEVILNLKSKEGEVKEFHRMFNFLESNECANKYPKYHKYQILKVWQASVIYDLKAPHIVTYEDYLIETFIRVFDKAAGDLKKWDSPMLYWYITVGNNAESLMKNLKKIGLLRETDITKKFDSINRTFKIFSSKEFTMVYNNFLTATEVQGEVIKRFQDLRPGNNEITVKDWDIDIRNFPIFLTPQIPVIDLAMEAATIRMEKEPTVDQTTYLPNDSQMAQIVSRWYQQAPALKNCFFKLIPPPETKKPVNKLENMSDEEYRESMKQAELGYKSVENFIEDITDKRIQDKIKKVQSNLDNLSKLVKSHKKRLDKPTESFAVSHLDGTQSLYQDIHTNLMNENVKVSVYNIKLISRDLIDSMKTISALNGLMADMQSAHKMSKFR